MSKVIQNEHSTEWLQVKEFCQTRLTEMREDNDADIDPIETAKLRGRIAFAIEVLELAHDEPTISGEPTRYID